MLVFLDNRSVDTGAITTLDQAIDAAARQAEHTGRLIVEVLVDGRSLNEEELEFERRKQTPPSEVRLQTADPHIMLRQTFADAADALAQADSLQRDAAVMIESDRHADAMDQLAGALEIWSSVHRAVSLGIEIGGIDLDAAAPPDGVTPAATIAGLEQPLRTVRDALAGHDTVGLSDALQYDLPDIVASWREMLTHLQDQLDAAIGNAPEHTGP